MDMNLGQRLTTYETVKIFLVKKTCVAPLGLAAKILGFSEIERMK